MQKFMQLPKLQRGDKVAILSPSFAAPGKWPLVYELGLSRLREVFGLEPVEFPTTKKLGATKEERAKDLVAAFERKDIKGVISSLGGDDQVTYIKNLPKEPFMQNTKPFFGYSDNTHFMNFLWLCGIPSFYGGALFTQFAEPGELNNFTQKYLKLALFEHGESEIEASSVYHDGEAGIDWNKPETLQKNRDYQPNIAWFWDGSQDTKGVTWGGCVESIDEMLRHGITIPSLEDFEQIILLAETSEEIPSSDYVFRVFRALGERGILERLRGILVGRPKAWEFDKHQSEPEKENYREKQRETIINVVRQYNKKIPIIQNLDFGHTDPQIPMPYGGEVRIEGKNKKIFVCF